MLSSNKLNIMKKLLFYLFVITLYSCGGGTSGECGGITVNYSDEKENIEKKKDGVFYKGTLFSGTMVSTGIEQSKTVEYKTCFKDGIKNGPHEVYYGSINGQLKQRVMFKDGKEHGIGEEYDRDGKKTMEVRYENGTLMLGNW